MKHALFRYVLAAVGMAVGASLFAATKTVTWSLSDGWADDARVVPVKVKGAGESQYFTIVGNGELLPRSGVGEVGEPDLPYYRIRVALPETGTFKGVTTEVEWEAMSVGIGAGGSAETRNNKLVPIPIAQPVPTGSEVIYPQPGPAYATVYPAKVAQEEYLQIMSDVRMMPIVVTPFRWDGPTKTLYRAKKLTLKAEIDVPEARRRLAAATVASVAASVGSVGAEGSAETRGIDFQKLALGMTINPEDATTTAARGLAATPARTAAAAWQNLACQGTDSASDYVIISPHKFVDLWKKFATFRRTTDNGKSHTFCVVDADDIYANYASVGGDDALKIHHYIEDLYDLEPRNIKYVVLGAAAKKYQYDNQTMIPARYVVCGGSISQLLDMYYGCMDRLPADTGVEVWDYDGDGTYLGHKNANGSYSGDSNAYIDWAQDLTVFRFPLMAEVVEAGIKLTASEIMDNFIAKIRRVESDSYADRYSAILTGSTGFSTSWRGGASRVEMYGLITDEREFFDQGTNIFDPAHPTGASDSEYLPRDHNWEFLASLRGNRKVLMNNSSYSTCTYSDIYKTSGDFLDTVCHGWARGAVGAVGSDGSFQATGIYTIYDCAVPCDTGMFDYCPGGSYGITNCICVGEAPILAPNGGALASINNTRYGWSASWTTSYGLHEKGMAGQHSGRLSWLFMEALSGMTSWNRGQGYQPMDAGTALMYAHNQHGTPYASAAWGLSGAQVTGQGDPLARLAVQYSRTWESETKVGAGGSAETGGDETGEDETSVNVVSTNVASWRVAGVNAKQVFDVSREVSLPLTGRGDQTFDIEGTFSAAALYVGQDVGATLTIGVGAEGSAETGGDETGSFKIYRETVITNGNLCWKAEGGCGRYGVKFVGARGNITLPGNAKRYFGEKFLNVGKIDVCGGNVTIDTPRNATFDAALDYDEIAFVATNAAAVTEWNILRSRNPGLFRTSPEKHLPVVNSKLILQTYNIGGSGSGNADKPLIFATNATIKVQANPLWKEESFVRPTYLHHATLIGDYASFAFGPEDNKGYDLYVSGACEIAGDTPIRLNGNLRVHFLGANAALTISNPLTDGGTPSTVTFDGAGSVTFAAAQTFTGAFTVPTNVTVTATVADAFAAPVTVARGGALALAAIPLTGLTNLTVCAGGALHLPAPTYTGTYKIVDATTTSLTIEEGATVYDENGAVINGEVTQGHFVLASDQLVWQVAEGVWDKDAENTNVWKTASGNWAAFADNAPLRVGVGVGVGVGEVRVNVGCDVAPGFVDFRNQEDVYVFSAANDDLPTITFNSLIATTPVVFDVPLKVPGGILTTGGSLQLANVVTPTIDIADGGFLRATGRVDLASQQVKKLKFSFSGTRTDGNRAAISEFRLFNAKGRFMLPIGTIIRDVAGQKITITEGTQGETGQPCTGDVGDEALSALIDGNLNGGNKWWASKSALPTWFEITFPEPVDPLTGYAIRTADQEARDPRDWQVLAAAEDDGHWSVIDEQSGVRHNYRRSWMLYGGGDQFPIAAMSGLASVSGGGRLILDGTWCVDLELAAESVLVVTNQCALSAVHDGNRLLLPDTGSVLVDLATAAASDDPFAILTGYNITAEQFARFECATETAMLLLKDGDIYAATANVAVPPYAADVSGTLDWSTLAFADKNGASFTWAHSNVKATGTVTLNVTNDTTLTIDSVGTIAALTITGSGNLTVVAKDGVTPLAPALIDDTAHTGTLVWNVPVGSAAIRAGSDTRLYGGSAGTGLLTVGDGKKVTLGDGVTFANRAIDTKGWVRYEGAREEMSVDDLTDATYSFANASLVGNFERGNLTIRSTADDYVKLIGTNDNFYGRSLINYDITGGLVEIEPNGESCWFGQTATAGTTDATTFNQSGGIFRCLADGTSIGSGLLLAYTGGTDADEVFEIPLSGGLFEVPGSFLNFGNPTTFTMSYNGRLRAKGFASTMSKGTITLGSRGAESTDRAALEIGSLGFQNGAATITMHPNTFIVGFEPGAYLAENVILYGSKRSSTDDVMTVAATNGATLALRDMRFDFYEYEGQVFNGQEPVTFGHAGKDYTGEVILESESAFPKRWKIAAGTVNVGTIRAQVSSTLLAKPTDGKIIVVLTEEEYVSGAACEILYCGDWANALSSDELRAFITVKVDRSSGVVEEDTTGTMRCASGVVEFLPAGAAGYTFPISATASGFDLNWSELDWRDRQGVKYTNNWEGVISAELVCDTFANVTMDRSISMKRLTTRVSSDGVLQLGAGADATLTLTDKLDDSASTGTTQLNITLGAGMTVAAGKALQIYGAPDTTTEHGKLIIGANSQVTVMDGYWNGEVEMADETATLYYVGGEEALTAIPSSRNGTSVGTITYAARLSPADGKAQFGSTSARSVDGTYEFISGTELTADTFVTGLGNNTIQSFYMMGGTLDIDDTIVLSQDAGSQTAFYQTGGTLNASNATVTLGQGGKAIMTLKKGTCSVGGITTAGVDNNSGLTLVMTSIEVGAGGINIDSSIHKENVQYYPITMQSGTIVSTHDADITVPNGIGVYVGLTLTPAANTTLSVHAPLERYYMNKTTQAGAAALTINGAGRVTLYEKSDLAGTTIGATGYTYLKSGTLRLNARGLLNVSRVQFDGGKMEVLLSQDEAGQSNDYILFATTADANTVKSNTKVIVRETGSEVSGDFSISDGYVHFKPSTVTGITANIEEAFDGDWSAVGWTYAGGGAVDAGVWNQLIGTATLKNAANATLAFSGDCTLTTLTIDNSGTLDLGGTGTMTVGTVDDSASTGTTKIGAFLKPSELTAGKNTILAERGDYALSVPKGAHLTIPGWTTPSKVSGEGVVSIDMGARTTLVGNYWSKDGGVTGTNQLLSGTWEFTGNYPNGREILITGSNAVLRLKNNTDITGYNNVSGGITIEDGGAFEVYKRDTFSRKLVLRNGGKLLMNSDSNDNGRSLDLFTGSSLTVEGGAASMIGGTAQTVQAASGDPIVASGIVALRQSGFAVTVNADALLNVYAQWGGTHSTGNPWTKKGAGTMAFYRASGQTGTMTVSAGVVRLVNNGQGTTGNIVNNATLEVVTSNGFTKTLANAISGSGTIVKKGAGTLAFGTVRPTQPIRLDDGSLAFTLTAAEKATGDWICLFEKAGGENGWTENVVVYDTDGATPANVVASKVEEDKVYVKVEMYRMPITLENNSTMSTTWTEANWYDANNTLVTSDAWSDLSGRTNLAVVIAAHVDTTLTIDRALEINTLTIASADGRACLKRAAEDVGPYSWKANETAIHGTLKISGDWDLGVVSGDGTLVITNEIPAVKGLTALPTSAWTGCVRLQNVTTNALDLGTLANAASRVALDHVTTTAGLTVPSGVTVELTCENSDLQLQLATPTPVSGPVTFADGAIVKITMAEYAQEAAITDGTITANPAQVTLYVNGVLRPTGTWSVSGGKILLPLVGPYGATMTASGTWSSLGWLDSSATPIAVPTAFWTKAGASDVAHLTVDADATLSEVPTTALGLLKIDGAGILTFAETCALPLEIDASSVNGYALASNAVYGAAFSRWLVKGNLTGTVTVTNAPAMPKGYQVAVDDVAGLGVRLVVTAPEEAKLGVISLNLNQNATLTGAGDHGLHPDALANWGNLTAAANGSATVSNVTFTIGDSASGYHLDNTPPDMIYKQYMDDSSTTRTITITNIPFAAYRVIVHYSTDTANANFRPLHVTGSAVDDWYAGPTATIDSTTATTVSYTVKGRNAVWGHAGASHNANAPAEGVNALVTDVYAQPALTLGFTRNGGTGARATPCAIQIVKVGDIVVPDDPDPQTWTNPVTGDEQTFAYAFLGTTDDDWSTVANWRTYGKTKWSGTVSGIAPLVHSSEKWGAAVIDGELIAAARSSSAPYQSENGVAVNLPASSILEGWELKLALFNGVNVTVGELSKLANTTWLWVDATSSIAFTKWATSGNSTGPADYYVAAENGITYNMTFDRGIAVNYHFKDAGSVNYAAGFSGGTHTVKRADFTLAAHGAGTRIMRKKLIGFTGSYATVTLASDAVVTLKDGGQELTALPEVEAATRSETALTGDEALGTYAFVRLADGYYLEYIDRAGTPETFASYVVGAWDGFENLASLTNPAGFAYVANLNGAAVNDDGSVTIGTKPLAVTGGQTWIHRSSISGGTSASGLVLAMLVSDYAYGGSAASLMSLKASNKDDYIGWCTGGAAGEKGFAYYNQTATRAGNNTGSTGNMPGDGKRYWIFLQYNNDGVRVQGVRAGASAMTTYVYDGGDKDNNKPGLAFDFGGKTDGTWMAAGMNVYAIRICNCNLTDAQKLSFATDNTRYQELGDARTTDVEMRGTPVLWVTATEAERAAGKVVIALPNFNGPLEDAVVHAETSDGGELVTYAVACDDAARTVTATISADGPKHFTGTVSSSGTLADLAWNETMAYVACNTATLTVDGDVTLTLDGTEVLKRLDVVGSGTLNLVLEDGAAIPAVKAFGLGDFAGVVAFGFDPGSAVRVEIGANATAAFAEKPTCAISNGGWIRYDFAYTGKPQDRYEYAGAGNALTLYGSAQSGGQYRLGGSGTFSGAAIDNEFNGGATVTWSGDYAASGNTYLGMTHGTLNIATGACVRVPHVRILNSGANANRATLNVDGTLVVTSTSSDANVWNERGSYRGILFGHWHGQGTYNINPTGRLLATNAYLQIVYTAEAQALNVKGGELKVRAIQANEANDGTVTLSDGGVLELAEGYLGKAVIQNYGEGTIRAYSYNASTTLTLGQAMTLTDATQGTTFDPAGLAIDITGAINGSGKLVVNDSAATPGTVRLEASALQSADLPTFQTTVRRGTLACAAGTMKGAVTLARDGIIDLTSSVGTNAYAITSGTLTLGEGASVTNNITVNGAALDATWRLNAAGNGIEQVTEVEVNPSETSDIIAASETNDVKIVTTWTNGEDEVRLDLTPAFTLEKVAGGVKATLNPAGKVTVKATGEAVGEEISVTPELTEAGDEKGVEPMVVGDDVSVGVKTIPGLTYELLRGSKPGTYDEANPVDRTRATGTRTELTDDDKPSDRAFYIIRVRQ